MKRGYFIDREYTDDGCSVFLCLGCYSSWEGRTGRDFKFCPYCGDAIQLQESNDTHGRYGISHGKRTFALVEQMSYRILKKEITYNKEGEVIKNRSWSHVSSWDIKSDKEVPDNFNELPAQQRRRIMCLQDLRWLVDNPPDHVVFSDEMDNYGVVQYAVFLERYGKTYSKPLMVVEAKMPNKDFAEIEY